MTTAPNRRPDSDLRLIIAGTLIDGTGARAMNEAGIVVQGERIIEVGSASALRAAMSDRSEIVDLGDCTVMPGLVDAHFHVSYCGHLGIRELEYPASLEYTAVCAGANARTVLEAGCTSALDVGCRGGIAVAVREAVEGGRIRGPRMRASGQVIGTRGGPLDFWPSTMAFDPNVRLFAFASGTEEVRALVRAQVKAGVDNVKVQITRSTVQQQRGGSPITFTPDELQVAVGTAHDNGISASAHAEGPAGIAAAIDAGFDTIQHASFIDDRTIDLLEQHPETRIVFTLGVYEGIIRRGPGLGYPLDVVGRVAETWPRMLAAVRLAADRGVAFAVGSDAGGRVHPHGRLGREIVLLVQECGLSVEAAIRAATSSAAEAAWLPDAGTIRADGIADLLAVRGDLTSKIEALEDPIGVALVAQRGRFVVDRRPLAVAVPA